MMKPLAFGATTVASAIAVSLLGASPVYAQGAAAEQESSGGLEEVVVTAQFREERLQDTPIAITAVSDEMLRARGQTSIVQLTNEAPSVQLRPAPAAFGPGLNAFIRGIGQGDFNFAFEPGVGVYVDDVYYSTLHGAVLDLLDLERVEVLRGPQGTLQGRNSIGGAIRLITKKPTGDGGGFVDVGFGQFNMVTARGAGELALVPDKLFMRIAGVTKHQDGYQNRVDFACANGFPAGVPTNLSGSASDCTVGTAGGKSYSSGRVSLRWVPNDRLEINLAGDVTDDNSEVQASTLRFARPITTVPGYGSQFVPTSPDVTYSTFCDNGLAAAPFGGPPITNPFGTFCIPPVNKIWQAGGSANIEFKINDSLSLKSITAYRQFKAAFAEDVDGSPLPAETVFNNTFHHGFQQELQLNGTASRLDYTFGGFYFKQTNRNSNRVDIPYVTGLGRVLDFTSNDPVTSDTWAAFVHGAWHLSDPLTITTGLRYSKETKDYTFSRLNPDNSGGNPIVGSLTGTTGHYEGSKLDYRFSLDYRFNPQLLTYIGYSTGFKGGGINPRPFFVSQVVPFGKETLDTAELGLKSDLWDRRLRLNAAIFYSWYKDMQLVPLSCDDISPFPGAPCAAPRNLADSHISGAEVEMAFRPTQAFSIDASVSYLKFSYSRLDPAALGSVDPNADTPAATPKTQASLGVQYELPIGEYGSLTPRFDVYHQSDINGLSSATAAPWQVVHSYTTVNGRLTWRGPSDKWEAGVEVDNLTDKEYFYNTFDLSGLAGFAQAQPAPPRTWSVNFRRTFD